MSTANMVPALEIPLWQPHDFEFKSSTSHDNPYLVPFNAHISGPGGIEMKAPGFYDGEGIWKIRFSPTAKGKWSLKTSSSDPDLNGHEITGIICVDQTNPRVHGGLRVDPANTRHFIFEDGSRFFLMGYECDWLWALDTTRPDLPVVNAFLDKLSSYGFNYIILNVYAHDTNWKKGRSELRDYGPPPIYPWEGTNEEPRQDRLNPAFWQHYDRIIRAMYERGMIAHIMTKVYNKMVNWPAKNSPEEELFYRTLIARYSAFPNVIWDFSKEANNERDFQYKASKIRFIKENDPYKRLFTVHDDSATYDRGAYAELLDYRSDQQHDKWHETILKQRSQKDWPVVNVEFGYEWGPEGEGDSTYPPCQSPEEVVRRAWEIYMAGGYGAYYYTYTAWDIIHPEHNPPGYAYFRNLREFFESTKYWLMRPHDELVSKGFCLADPGREYIVFQQEPGEFTLKLDGTGPFVAEWFNPLTGNKVVADQLRIGVNEIAVPEWLTDFPILLRVQKARII